MLELRRWWLEPQMLSLLLLLLPLALPFGFCQLSVALLLKFGVCFRQIVHFVVPWRDLLELLFGNQPALRRLEPCASLACETAALVGRGKTSLRWHLYPSMLA